MCVLPQRCGEQRASGTATSWRGGGEHRCEEGNPWHGGSRPDPHNGPLWDSVRGPKHTWPQRSVVRTPDVVFSLQAQLWLGVGGQGCRDSKPLLQTGSPGNLPQRGAQASTGLVPTGRFPPLQLQGDLNWRSGLEMKGWGAPPSTPRP